MKQDKEIKMNLGKTCPNYIFWKMHHKVLAICKIFDTMQTWIGVANSCDDWTENKGGA